MVHPMLLLDVTNLFGGFMVDLLDQFCRGVSTMVSILFCCSIQLAQNNELVWTHSFRLQYQKVHQPWLRWNMTPQYFILRPSCSYWWYNDLQWYLCVVFVCVCVCCLFQKEPLLLFIFSLPCSLITCKNWERQIEGKAQVLCFFLECFSGNWRLYSSFYQLSL